MRWLKPLEVAGKLVLATIAAALLWRPWRSARAARQLADARRFLIVRIDDRVGEALLTTPLLEALKGRGDVEVLVHPRVARVLEGHPLARRVRAFTRSLASVLE